MITRHKLIRSIRRANILLQEGYMSRLLPYNTSRKVRASILPRNYRSNILLKMALSGGAWLTRTQILSIEKSKYFLEKSSLTIMDYMHITIAKAILTLLYGPAFLLTFCALLIPPTRFKIKKHNISDCIADSVSSFWSEYYLTGWAGKKLLRSKKRYIVHEVQDLGDLVMINTLINSGGYSEKNLKARRSLGLTYASKSGFVLREARGGIEAASLVLLDKLSELLVEEKKGWHRDYILTRNNTLFLINEELYEFYTRLNLSNPCNLKAYNKETMRSIIKILRQEAC